MRKIVLVGVLASLVVACDVSPVEEASETLEQSDGTSPDYSACDLQYAMHVASAKYVKTMERDLTGSSPAPALQPKIDALIVGGSRAAMVRAWLLEAPVKGKLVDGFLARMSEIASSPTPTSTSVPSTATMAAYMNQDLFTIERIALTLSYAAFGDTNASFVNKVALYAHGTAENTTSLEKTTMLNGLTAGGWTRSDAAQYAIVGASALHGKNVVKQAYASVFGMAEPASAEVQQDWVRIATANGTTPLTFESLLAALYASNDNFYVRGTGRAGDALPAGNALPPNLTPGYTRAYAGYPTPIAPLSARAPDAAP